MFRSITSFLANKRGAFALQFALMAIPLTVCTGLAIDGGRAFLARFRKAPTSMRSPPNLSSATSGQNTTSRSSWNSWKWMATKKR